MQVGSFMAPPLPKKLVVQERAENGFVLKRPMFTSLSKCPGERGQMFIKVLIDKYGQTVTEGLQAVMHQRRYNSWQGNNYLCGNNFSHSSPGFTNFAVGATRVI